MGFFDGRPDTGSHHHKKSHSSSHSGIFGSSSGNKHNSSGIFGSGSHHHNRSTSSFFSIGGKSHKRASPRTGYLNRLYKQLRRLLRDLLYYLKRHPMKVFMLVIMPLITGGALTGLLRQFGIRLPMGITRLFGAGASMSSFGGTGIGRSAGGDLQFERTHYEGHGSSGGFGTAMNIAKMFM